MDFIAWRKSTYSGTQSNTQCVEVGLAPGRVGIRDTKNPEAGHLNVSATAFRSLVRFTRTQS